MKALGILIMGFPIFLIAYAVSIPLKEKLPSQTVDLCLVLVIYFTNILLTLLLYA